MGFVSGGTVKLISKSIKVTIGISIILLLGFIVIACTPAQETGIAAPPATSVPQPPVGFLMYNDVVNNFVIPYPEDWGMIPKETIEFALVGFRDSQQDAIVSSFLVMKAALPQEMDVEAYFESEKAYFPGEYANYTPISTNSLTLNGKKAIEHIWSFTSGENTLKYERLYIIDKKVVWLLESGCFKESFNDYKNTFDIMMSGFRILR